MIPIKRENQLSATNHISEHILSEIQRCSKRTIQIDLLFEHSDIVGALKIKIKN